MFSIVDYDTRYRPYNKSGEELKRADWVKLPVNPKGDGLQALLEYRRGLEVFGVWCLLLEKATDEDPENRGKLVNHKGEPASIPEIAKSISLKGKEKLVTYALSVLVAMGWVHSEEGSTEAEQIPTKSSVIKSNKTKSNETKSESAIFNHWNLFKGKKKWKSHNEMTYEIESAIKDRLKQYSIEQIKTTIDNYAKVLLSRDYTWSYAWTLRQFLTRHQKLPNQHDLQLYRFLESGFREDDYLSTDVRQIRAKERKEFYEFVRDCDEEKLIEAYRVNKNGRNWLIDEVRPEIKEKTKGVPK